MGYSLVVDGVGPEKQKLDIIVTDRRLRRTSHAKSASVPSPSPPHPQFPPGLRASPPPEPVLRRSKPFPLQAQPNPSLYNNLVREPQRQNSDDSIETVKPQASELRTDFKFQASFIDFKSDSSEAEDISISPVVREIVARKASKRSAFSQRPLSADSIYSTSSLALTDVSEVVQRPRTADGPREEAGAAWRRHNPSIPHYNAKFVPRLPAPLNPENASSVERRERGNGRTGSGDADVSRLLKSRVMTSDNGSAGLAGGVDTKSALSGSTIRGDEDEMAIEEDDLTTIDLREYTSDLGSVSVRPSSSAVGITPAHVPVNVIEPSAPPGLVSEFLVGMDACTDSLVLIGDC